MSQERYSEVISKDGEDYFVQEIHHNPKQYLCMIRNVRDVLVCEQKAVNEMPSKEL